MRFSSLIALATTLAVVAPAAFAQENGQEALVAYDPELRIENVGANDGRQVRQVHLAPGLLVDVREACHPFEEHEENLHRVSVGFGQQQRDQVQILLPICLIGQR